MPEGPETHYIADTLTETLVGDVLTRVFFEAPALKPYEAALTGRRVESVRARGKALLTRFDNALTLYTHSQLLGYWRIQRTARAADSAGKPKLTLATARGSASLYVAPKVEIWPDDRLDAHPYLAKLGPDVLDPEVDTADFVERLRSSRFRRTSLAALLLKQEFAAGMGNYLRSEVLFAARLSPQRKAGELDDDETLRLAHALLDVPRRSYRAKFKGNAMLSSKRYLAETKRGFRFHVFEREDQPCGGCGGEVRMDRLGGRRLYWCPRCQR